MKIVINKCYGGFDLSAKAEDLYAKKKGFKLFRYEQTKHKHKDGVDEYVLVSQSNSIFCYTFTKNFGATCNDLPNDAHWNSSEIERHDPILVEVVSELGTSESSGMFGQLEIIDIPNGTDYSIEEYDGIEWVAEKHRTWE